MTLQKTTQEADGTHPRLSHITDFVFYPKSSNSEQLLPFYWEKLSLVNTGYPKKSFTHIMFPQERGLKINTQPNKSVFTHGV